MLFDEIDIGHQRRARIAAFQQVVTEDEVFRKTSIDGLAKGVHIVDALADEGAFAEQILIDIRHFARVGIDARIAGEQFGEARLAGTGQADRGARLQDRVAFDDASRAGVVDRPIERMREVADQGARRVARQLRVGIQGDDVLDRSKHALIADDLHECRERPAAQPGVELLQLAALALVAHPYPLHRIPQPGSMEQIEDARTVVVIGRVERLHRRPRIREQGGIVRQRLLGRVAKIRQQRKEQVGIAIAEIADLQRLE